MLPHTPLSIPYTTLITYKSTPLHLTTLLTTQKYRSFFSPVPILTAFYRFLPILTAFYRFLRIPTDSYRLLPIRGYFFAHRAKKERLRIEQWPDVCGRHPYDFILSIRAKKVHRVNLAYNNLIAWPMESFLHKRDTFFSSDEKKKSTFANW